MKYSSTIQFSPTYLSMGISQSATKSNRFLWRFNRKHRLFSALSLPTSSPFELPYKLGAAFCACRLNCCSNCRKYSILNIVMATQSRWCHSSVQQYNTIVKVRVLHFYTFCSDRSVTQSQLASKLALTDMGSVIVLNVEWSIEWNERNRGQRKGQDKAAIREQSN